MSDKAKKALIRRLPKNLCDDDSTIFSNVLCTGVQWFIDEIFDYHRNTPKHLEKPPSKPHNVRSHSSPPTCNNYIRRDIGRLSVQVEHEWMKVNTE